MRNAQLYVLAAAILLTLGFAAFTVDIPDTLPLEPLWACALAGGWCGWAAVCCAMRKLTQEAEAA